MWRSDDFRDGISRRLHRQVGWLVALEVDIVGRAPELIDEIRTLGDQTARGGEVIVEPPRAPVVHAARGLRLGGRVKLEENMDILNVDQA